MKKSLIALALMAAAAVAAAFQAEPPGQAGGYPVVTQSVSSADYAAVKADRQATEIAVQAERTATVTAVGSDLVAMVHPGCDGSDSHPMAGKKGKSKRPPKCFGRT